MDNCDVYLHASLFEPFGIPPLDAVQRGKNVIVSDGVKSMVDLDFISHKVQIYPANDYMALFVCLKNIVETKERLYIDFKKTIIAFEKNYSLKNNMDAIKSALEQH